MTTTATVTSAAQTGNGPHRRARVRTRAGPLLTLATLVVSDIAARRGVHLQLPGLVPLIAITIAAALGGVLPGLVSAALTVGYALLPIAAAGPLAVDPDDAWLRITLLTTFAIGLGVGIGRMRECVDRTLHELRGTIAQLIDMNARLQYLSEMDSLTGIANRRHFDTAYARAWDKAADEATPLALILFDIDHFKSFNDRNGHQMGDEVLCRVARALTNQLRRPEDLVARYGGEEFVAVLPDTRARGAIAAADRLREAVANLALARDGSYNAARVTISVGVAVVIPSPCQSPNDLVKAADVALYRAKDAGRNRTEIACATMRLGQG